MLSTAYTIAITSFLPSKMCVCGGNIICATCIVFVSCTPYRTPSATFTHWIHIIHNVNTEKCRIGRTTTTTKMCLLQSYIGGIKYTYSNCDANSTETADASHYVTKNFISFDFVAFVICIFSHFQQLYFHLHCQLMLLTQRYMQYPRWWRHPRSFYWIFPKKNSVFLLRCNTKGFPRLRSVRMF